MVWCDFYVFVCIKINAVRQMKQIAYSESWPGVPVVNGLMNSLMEN